MTTINITFDSGDDPAVLQLYGNPQEVGWRGWVERKGGVESWIDLEGRFHPRDAYEKGGE